ncbi:MAG: hypothetical protein ACYTE8_03105 [Planctomycetota bacterium]|jgi:hypothetical protein
MSDPYEEKFREYWKHTEIIREYQRVLFTFGDMELPYVFVAESRQLSERTVVRKGTVFLQRPRIVLPGQSRGPEFEGFEHPDAIGREAAFLFRAAKLPISHITNKLFAQEKLEYGRAEDVIERISSEMDLRNDTDTGLVKGSVDGADVSLIRYSFGLAIKSAPDNIREFLEHTRKHKGKPIRADEKITDEELRKLFG